MCHDGNEERKGPYQIYIWNWFDLRPSGFYTVSPTCSALRAAVKESKLWVRDS